MSYLPSVSSESGEYQLKVMTTGTKYSEDCTKMIKGRYFPVLSLASLLVRDYCFLLEYKSSSV